MNKTYRYRCDDFIGCGRDFESHAAPYECPLCETVFCGDECCGHFYHELGEATCLSGSTSHSTVD